MNTNKENILILLINSFTRLPNYFTILISLHCVFMHLLQITTDKKEAGVLPSQNLVLWICIV